MAERRNRDPLRADMSVVESSGLFDRDWYRASYPDIGADPLQHFCRDGWRQDLRPNPYFDCAWYTRTYGAEFLPEENPLLHYIRVGEGENAWPSPHFDPEWYRDKYGIGESTSPLGHYLSNSASGKHSPRPDFDAAAHTEENPDYLTTAKDPYLHWLQQPKRVPDPMAVSASPYAVVLDAVGGNLALGKIPDEVPWEALKQALRPFISFIPFDDAWYRSQYPDVAAAVDCGVITSAHDHFVAYGFFEGRSPGARWRSE